MLDDLENDIPLDVAQRAHAGTSFIPEERGEQERKSYASQLRLDHVELAKLATTEEKSATLEIEFARYREGFRDRYIAQLAAKARCISTMITGGSNFPTRRNQKRSAAADKRVSEMIQFRTRAIAAIRRELTPELAPIMAGDADAIARIDSKLESAEKLQALMVASNAAIRKHAGRDGFPYPGLGPEAQIAALVELGHQPKVAARLLEPDSMGRIGFADYEIKNNGANIRRMKARGAAIATTQAEPDLEFEGEHAKLLDCPRENRVRLFFPGKPDPEVRAGLKSAGFRWAPSIRCWQAYRNTRSLEVARRKAGIKES